MARQYTFNLNETEVRMIMAALSYHRLRDTVSKAEDSHILAIMNYMNKELIDG